MKKFDRRLSFTVGLIVTILFFAYLVANNISKSFILKIFNTTSKNVQAQIPANTDWYTVAANPQRSSWVNNEVPGDLRGEWFYYIPYYISQKVQPIITNNTAYIASSKGLYALNIGGTVNYNSDREAPSSMLKWIYCTSTTPKKANGECPDDELPLGNSPTVINNVAYVGGYDKRVHAIDIASGNKIWISAEAEAGFETNPLVVGTKLFIGNRDGYMYALNLSGGSIAWKYKTNGPILQSAAASKDGNTIFFASNDMYAYAVKATTANVNGELVWQSDGDPGTPVKDKFPGNGFHSYWPVVTKQRDPKDGQVKEYVVFNGIQSWGNSNDEEFYCTNRANRVVGRFICEYRAECATNYNTCNLDPVDPSYPQHDPALLPTIPSSDPWTTVGEQTIETNRISDYLRDKPWRRNFFVLNTSNGSEYMVNRSDYDPTGGGLAYAPFPQSGADHGTRYPSVYKPATNSTDPDGPLFQRTSYEEGGIPRGNLVGWKFGTTTVSYPTGSHANDEPTAFSYGGNLIYSRAQNEVNASSFNVATPSQIKLVAGSNPPRYTVSKNDTLYFDYNTFGQQLPALQNKRWPFAYGKQNDRNPLVPYNGKLYLIANNALVAFSSNGAAIGTVDRGYNSGVAPATLKKSTLVASAWGTVTADDATWPTLLQQERYFPFYSSWDRQFSVFSVAADTTVPSSHTVLPTQTTAHLDNPAQADEITTSFSTGTLKTYVSRRTPTVLFQNNSTSQYLLNGSIKGVAYQSASGIQHIDSNSGPIQGSSITEGWLLLWDDDTVKPLTMTGNPPIPSGDQPQLNRWHPMVIALEKQPLQVELTTSGLKITYQTGTAAGYLAATPLKGMSAPIPWKTYYGVDRSNSELDEWKQGRFTVSGFDAIAKAKQLAEISRSFPTAWTDTTQIIGTNAEVKTVYTSRIEFNSWPGIKLPKKVAFISPSLALASWNNPLITVTGTKLDLNYPLPLGRLAGIENTDTATVTLQNITKYWKNPIADPTPPISGDSVQARLEQEIQKMITAGHLRPGYIQHGTVENVNNDSGTEWLFEYFHSPGDLITTLLKALPLLPNTPYPNDPSKTWKEKLRDYIQQEYQDYSPETYVHIGYGQGARREISDPLPDFEASFNDFGPVGPPRTTAHGADRAWDFTPTNFCAVYLYAKNIDTDPIVRTNRFNTVKNKLKDPLLFNRFKSKNTYVVNTYIDGYICYLKLAALANQPTQTTFENRLVDLFILRTALSKNPESLAQTGFEYGKYNWIVHSYEPHIGEIKFHRNEIGSIWTQYDAYGARYVQVSLQVTGGNGGLYNFAIDFVNMTPELGQFMRDFTPNEFNKLMQSRHNAVPYWFVSKAEEVGGEATLVPLQDTIALFQAMQYGGKDIEGNPISREKLLKYLDVPAFDRGDLYYIQRLTGILSAPAEGTIPTVTPTPIISPCTPLGDTNCSGKINILDLSLILFKFNTSESQYDLNTDGVVNLQDISILLGNYGK